MVSLAGVRFILLYPSLSAYLSDPSPSTSFFRILQIFISATFKPPSTSDNIRECYLEFPLYSPYQVDVFEKFLFVIFFDFYLLYIVFPASGIILFLMNRVEHQKFNKTDTEWWSYGSAPKLKVHTRFLVEFYRLFAI